jgi:hypothetical protein
VDPVSHLLFGRVMSCTLTNQSSRAPMSVALVVGSIMPDMDAVFGPIRFDIYLWVHASGTHSLLGTVIEAVVLAGVLRMWFGGMRWLPVLLASWIGLLGHVFWDLADGSDITIFRPVSDAVFGWHLVSMGEPLVLFVLLAAVLVIWWRPAPARRIAAAGIATLVCILMIKAASQLAAKSVYARGVHGEPPAAAAITPIFGRLFTWMFYDRAGETIRGWQIDSISGSMTPAFSYQDASSSPGASISRDMPVVRTFLSLSRIPLVRTVPDGEDRFVLWSDATSCSVRGCDVSFGALLDGRLTPIFQVIQIGGFRQIRAVPSTR